MRQQVLDFPVSARCRFETFVVCTGNRTAHDFAQRLLAPDSAENLLYLHGPAGSGKTHLLLALKERLARQAGTTSFPHLSFRELNLPATGELELAPLLGEAPALLVDDIHLMPPLSSLHTQLWQIFNDYYGEGKKIVVTGLHPPRELPGLDEHLVSRLLWGLVAKVDVSDDESRRMIMKKLAADRQVFVPAEVIDYLLTHTRRDLPSLIAALEQLHHLALAEKRRITLRLARQTLGAETAGTGSDLPQGEDHDEPETDRRGADRGAEHPPGGEPQGTP